MRAQCGSVWPSVWLCAAALSSFAQAGARVDYDTLASSVRGQLLVGWTPHPGTSLYVGCNDDLNYNGYGPFTNQFERGLRPNYSTMNTIQMRDDPTHHDRRVSRRGAEEAGPFTNKRELKKDMSEIQTIIDELKNIHDGAAWHGPSLKEILSGVTAEQAAAKPLANAHSIWELTLHVAAWEGVFTLRLAGLQRNEPEEGDFPVVNDASEEAWLRTLASFDERHYRLIEAVSALTDERLSEIVPGKEYTIEYMLRGLIRHHVYHAGQIALLKKR